MNNDKLMENIINTPEKLPAILLPPSLLRHHKQPALQRTLACMYYEFPR